MAVQYHSSFDMYILSIIVDIFCKLLIRGMAIHTQAEMWAVIIVEAGKAI